MAISSLRVKSCLLGQGLTDIDRASLKAKAAKYNTGDPGKDYILAVKDKLESLRAFRAAIVEQVAAAAPAAVIPEAPAATVTPEEVATTAAAVPKEISKEELAADAAATVVELGPIQSAIETVETTKSVEEYTTSLAWLMGELYGADANDKRGKIRRADIIRDFIADLPVDTQFREALRMFARAEGVLTIVRRNNVINPMWDQILRADAFDLLKKIASFDSLPPGYESPATPAPTPEKVARKATKAKDLFDPSPDAIANPKAFALAETIRDINASATRLVRAKERDKITLLKKMWKAVVAEKSTEYITASGEPLSAYFDEDGDPLTDRVDGKFQVVTEVREQSTREKVEADLRAGDVAEADTYEPDNVLNDWEYKGFGRKESEDFNPEAAYERGETADVEVGREATSKVESELRKIAREMGLKSPKGRYFRDDGKQITERVPPGRIKLLVANFLRKLSVKPTVHVYKNQADFKFKDPAAYARAVAARPQGDFDTANAVGYSFGNGEIVLFTDRMVTERQVKFVLAHETLGHFGFRALVPERELNAILEMIYNESDRVKAAVDIAMQARPGMSKSEAIEEHLADFAGTLDTNVLARFWNAVKDFLNKFGFKFDDDMARFFVAQSRAYVRNGTTSGQFVDVRKMAERYMSLETVQDPAGSGRYAQAEESFTEYNRMAAGLALNPSQSADYEGAMNWARDRGTNIGEKWDKLLANLKTMNYASRENLGYRALYNILRKTVHTAAMLRSKYNSMMHTILTPALEVNGVVIGGKDRPKQSEIDLTNRMLNITTRIKMRGLRDDELRKVGPLFNFVDGEAVPNTDVIEALQKRGRITLEQFQNGFKYTTTKPVEMNDTERARLKAEMDDKLSKVEEGEDADAERKAIKKEYFELMEANTYMVGEERTFDPIPNLTADSHAWKMYIEVRDTMDAAALDVMQANFAAAKGERDAVLRTVRRFLGRALTDADKEFINKVEDKYLTLRFEGSKISEEGYVRVVKASADKANEFIAKFNQAVLGKQTDLNGAVQAFFDQKEADDVFKGIERLKAGSQIKRSDNSKYTMQQAIQNLALFELSKEDAQMLAKRSIAGGYVPLGREGAWQVRINAVNPETGRVYKMSEVYREQMVYMQVGTKAEALAAAKVVNDTFAEGNEKGTFRIEVLDEDGKFKVMDVKLVAQPETARQTISTASEANLNEVISTITRFSISITPQERERLVVGLTKQNERARTRLSRAGSPGEDPNTVKYVSQHLEAVASMVARKHTRHELDRLFDDKDGDSERLWNGSKELYDKKRKAWETAKADPAMDPLRKQALKRDFEDYHYTFVTKNSQMYANLYKDRAMRLVSFLDAQKDTEFTDFGSGETVSKIRMWTTFAHMGLSPATAILNYLSLSTNVLPSLAGYNPKNGFGGGFNWAKSSAELTGALAQTAHMSQSDITYWDGLLASPAKLKESGFTKLEAEFMRKEVASGTMQAALTNAMLGSARGKITSGLGQTAAKVWMGLFNHSEQHARRSTGLAAFRLAYQRALLEGKAAGLTEAQAIEQAFNKADMFAVEMIENTLGEYAMFNRPAMFRGGVAQFLFMYKMFPVNTFQMLRALPRKEQLLALGILMAMSGLKGLPFADDMMDILDTIAQMLGLGPRWLWKGSAEKTLASALDAVAPGVSPYMLRGAANHILPANISDRVSMGNMIPGTGIGLAGADVGRELVEVLGPFASFVQGSVAWTGQAARLALEPSEAGVTSLARKSPITMMRAAGDMMAYASTGAIVSQKGYVVSPDLHAGVFLARALGFYPSSAVAENDVVRMSTRLMDYRKDIASHYYGAYVAASLDNDADAVANVLRRVDDWNEASKGTELELPNFRRQAAKALREAQRPATERYMRTIPINARRETQRVMDLVLTGDEQAAAEAASN